MSGLYSFASPDKEKAGGGAHTRQLHFLAVVGRCRRVAATIDSCSEPTHANANIDPDARDPFLVPCFKLVSAPPFAVYRMDPYVVVFCPPALGGCVVGFSSQGARPDLYSRASGVRLVVLDSPRDRDPGLERLWGFSQE
jgi:hypothetical protein